MGSFYKIYIYLTKFQKIVCYMLFVKINKNIELKTNQLPKILEL